MTAKSLIHYFEVKSETGSTFKRTDHPDGSYEIVALQFDDPSIEEWIMKRFVALLKIQYIYTLYIGTKDDSLNRRLEYLLKKDGRAPKNVRISINPTNNIRRISYLGTEFDLGEFDCYKETLSIKLERLRDTIKGEVDRAMIKLGEVCEKQEKIEAKIKEFGLEDYD